MMKKELSNKEKWSLVGDIIFDPKMIILAILIIACLVGFCVNEGNADMRYVIGAFIAILSSIYSGIASNKWLSATEMQLIEMRGRSAIRNLSSIKSRISSVEHRIHCFLKECEGKENTELIKAHFEELDYSIIDLRRSTIDAIENWQDLIPEADYSEYLKREKQIQKEIEKSRIKLESIKEQGEETVHKQVVTSLQTEILDLQNQLSECRNDSPFFSGSMHDETCYYCQCGWSGHHHQCMHDGDDMKCPQCNKAVQC